MDTAFIGLTSCRRITIAKTLADWRRGCTTGIMLTAVSLWIGSQPSQRVAGNVFRTELTKSLVRNAQE